MRPFVKFVFIALATSALSLASGMGSHASAQEKRLVVVELFKGPNADKVRLAVVRALLKQQRVQVVQIKKVAMVEADLGLIRASDNYSAVARELKNSAFIGGTVMPGRRPRARIVVRGADGGVVGQTAFMGVNMGRLLKNIDKGGGAKLAGLIGNARGGPGAEPLPGEPTPPPAVAAEQPAAPEVPPLPEIPPPPPEPVAVARKEPPARANRSAAASVSAEAPPPRRGGAVAKAESKAKPASSLNLAFVMRMFSRNFSYNQNAKGGQQGYQAPEQKYNNLPLVPAPGLAVEYFPLSYLGFSGAYNRAIAGSKDSAGSVYSTTAYDWSLNGRGRFDVLGLQLEPTLGYVAKVFSVENFTSDLNRIQVAPVAYRHARVGVGVRMPLSSGSAISAGGAYLHTLGAGEILDQSKYFDGSALAGGAFAAMTMPLGFAKGFDLRFGADYRRIAFAFTPNISADRIAGGAVDQYIGVNFGVGYNLDL